MTGASPDGTPRRRAAIELGLLALAPLVVALASAPGRMPADTKLGLYLDPGRLVAQAPRTFDPSLHGGWVPHQSIGYLWPSGPWYLLGELAGLPDWIVHRLWIATILFAAGAGVRWLGRLVGLGPTGAFVAAVVYELSPYVVPYVSRTSLMLAPYAALGWIVGLTIRAARTDRWAPAAAVALVVATVGAPNATALAMIVPAPAAWLAHAASRGDLTWRRATVTAARIGVLCVAVSLWWVAMLVVQSRHGADVLAYSETLEAVSYTSSSVEVLRGLGYWLFYVRDAVGFATAGAEPFLTSVAVVAATAAVTGLGTTGLVVCRFAARGYAIVLVAVGTVLAVGVHPIDDPAPLWAPLADRPDSTFVLALRSSTRALPLVALGLGLGLGALVAASTRWVRARNPAFAAAPAVAVLSVVVVAAPTWWGRDLVDPLLERDADPPAGWLDAAAALDEGTVGEPGRVLQLPGQDFGVYRWGTTVDQVLPSLTDRPVLARDLLPLGSPATMDLLYALDDRLQDGVAEPASLAPVARLLGADTVAVVHDTVADRYRTPRPDRVAELVVDAPGLGAPRTFGEAAPPGALTSSVSAESIARRDAVVDVEPIWLVDVDDPVPVIRAKTQVVALAGSGDGVVDAAAAGLIDGDETIVYTAAMPAEARPDRVVVTDSHRAGARHWRGTQDVRGFTEDDDPAPDLLEVDPADRRLDPFGRVASVAGPGSRTVAIQEGPVRARVSAYGEPFAYRPEDRAVMAIDGDRSTAWRVGDRADPVGHRIELTFDEPTTEIRVLQVTTAATGRPADRWITAVDVEVDGDSSRRVALDDSSRTDGQILTLPSAGRTVVVTIAEVATGRDAVGFAEIRVDGRDPTLEVVRPPTDWRRREGLDVRHVLTRWRVDPLDRWRRDPEPRLVRRLATADDGRVGRIELRWSADATDDLLVELLGIDGAAVASTRLHGARAASGPAMTDGDPDSVWVGPLDGPTGHVIRMTTAAGPVERLTLARPDGEWSTIRRVTVVDASGSPRAVELSDDGESGVVEPPLAGGDWTITVDDVDVRTGWDRRVAEPVALPVAVAEITTSPTPTVVRPLPATVDVGCRDDLLAIDGRAMPVLVGRVDVADLLAGTSIVAAPCPTAAAVPAGEHLMVSSVGRTTGFDVDRVVLAEGPPDGAATVTGTTDDSTTGIAPGPSGSVAVEVRSSGPLHRSLVVAPCPEGCWLVVGEGHADAWRAEAAGVDLGPPALVDGGSNGWWLEPSTDERSIEVRWTAQGPVTWALVASVLAVLGCVVLVVVGRGRRSASSDAPADDGSARFSSPWAATPVRHRWLPAVIGGVGGALVVGPLWGLLGLALGTAAGALRRPRASGVVAVALWALVSATLLWRVARYRPFADPNWVRVFDDRHELGVFVVVLLVATLAGRASPAEEHATAPATTPAPVGGVADPPRPER